MPKTLLNGVNEVLKRVGVIAGDAGLLTTLIDSARQRAVDAAIQVINEGVDDLFSVSQTALPKEQAEGTITLVAGTRAYALASDLVQLRWPLIDKTNAQFISEFAGGYNNILQTDLEQDDTGLPFAAALRTTDGYLYLDHTPTAAEAGRVYTYQYDKDLTLDAAADTVPFSDACFRAMVPCWVQLWKREMRNEFDGDLFQVNLGRASRFLTQKHARTSYFPG